MKTSYTIGLSMLDPPKPRVAVIAWDNMEKLQAYRNSAEFKEIRPIGDKYAKFRGFTVEGLPQ
jgi:heme-degrading monooxygenase HmoA